MSELAASRSLGLRTVVLLAVLLGALQLSRFTSGDYAIDDAWISFRMARNWLAGGGLTFNPGEIPVEGMTNLLWTLLSASWIGVSPDVDPMFVARCVGALLFLASIGAAVELAHRVTRDRGGNALWAAAATAWVVAWSGSLAYHSMSGLETPLWGFLFVLSLSLGYRAGSNPGSWPWAGGCLGLLAMTRPEGVAVAALLCLGAGMAYGRSALTMGLAAGMVVAGMEVFRWSYYGALVPNTFWAKPPDAALGWEYAAEYFAYGLGFVGVLGCFCCLKVVRASRWLALLAVLLVAGTIWSGGDWMAGHRRFTLVTWLTAIGVGVGVGLPASRRLAALAALGCALGPGVAALRGVDAQSVPMDFMTSLGAKAQQSGLDGAALVDVGRFGWMFRGSIFDLVGLTDRHVAAQPGDLNEKRWDEAYFRSRSPDIVFVRIETEIADPLPSMPAVAHPDDKVLRSILDEGGYHTRAFHHFADDRVYVLFARDDLSLDSKIWGSPPEKGLKQLMTERYYLDHPRP